MTYTYKLARRLAISRHLSMVTGLLIMLAGCAGDTTGPDPSSQYGNLVALRIVPSAATIETDQKIRFRGETPAGEYFAAPLSWASSGGAILDDGTFYATEPGLYKVVASGRGRQKTDTSLVVVVRKRSDLTALEVAPDTAALSAGQAHTFSAVGRLADSTTAPVGVSWSATGGTIDAGGKYKAGITPGTYRVIAKKPSNQLADTAVVVIASSEPPAPPPEEPTSPSSPTLESVIVTPVSASLLTSETKRFAAYGRNSAGDSVAVTATFTATGGTINSTGLYTAGQSTGTYRVIATSAGVADTAVVSVSAPPTWGGVGVPFGPFNGWNGGSLKTNMDPFSTSQDATTASTILERIAEARTRKVHLMMAMMGGANSQYLTDGVFDRAKWRARLQTFNTSTIRQAVAQAVSDGTVLGTNVMDEPFNPKWGPKGTMTKARVDSLCADVKAIFPTLPVGPTHDHDDFEPTKSYRVCDFIVSQYRKAKGDVSTFRDAGLALAQRDGHAIAFSMNILDGGTPDRDGTWDCAGTGGKGTYAPNCRMTAAQLREFGRVLGPAGCAMLMWRYDDAFMADPDNALAFRDVGSLLVTAQRKSCRRP